MNLAIVGSRGITLDISHYLSLFAKIDTIISGGAKGIDSCAEAYARKNNIPTQIFLPDYKRFGRSAPIVRNRDIVSASDAVLAFWDGESRGTEYTMEYAKKLNIPVFVVILKVEHEQLHLT